LNWLPLPNSNRVAMIIVRLNLAICGTVIILRFRQKFGNRFTRPQLHVHNNKQPNPKLPDDGGEIPGLNEIIGATCAIEGNAYWIALVVSWMQTLGSQPVMPKNTGTIQFSTTFIPFMLN
jgi:hypothetical protein